MPTSTARRLMPMLSLAAALAVAAMPDTPAHAQAGARERTLVVSALDSSGEPVEALGPGDVIVREDGVRREVLRVSPATEPIDIALLVDNSAAADDSILRIRDGLRAFVAEMAKGNQIAIVTLADRPTILVDYTSSVERLEEGIDRLFARSMSGMTLLDAIVETSRGLARRETPRAAVVAIINDGVEFTNRDHGSAVEALENAGAAFHAITIGTFYAGADFASRERALLLDAGPRETGGHRVTILTPMAVEGALEKLARQLSSQYKVVYGRPESLIPPEEIAVTSGRSGVTVRGTPMRGQAGD